MTAYIGILPWRLQEYEGRVKVKRVERKKKLTAQVRKLLTNRIHFLLPIPPPSAVGREEGLVGKAGGWWDYNSP